MPVKFFLQDSPLAPPACSLVLNLVLVVKPETYRTQNQIHKLQHDVLGGIHLAYLILVYVYVCFSERLIKIKPINIILEFLLVGTFQWYVVKHQVYKNRFLRLVGILQSEGMFDKLVIQHRILLPDLLSRETNRHILIVSKENADLYFPV